MAAASERSMPARVEIKKERRLRDAAAIAAAVRRMPEISTVVATVGSHGERMSGCSRLNG